MKIKELHLRNIASIEKADIDFENDPGLKDPDTGAAAQMFLIYGDTGTGKSILLDGIAMALFGKTPRTESIENKTRNTYTTAYGNEMNITSIEQYTRLGITDKDDCYSEVLFVGNDGIEYRAKMVLGLTKVVRGKMKGKLVSRKRWMLKEGDNDWIEGEQCGRKTETATGMNYEQFNRMAMLAQGMFANFLCGSREERADILERLTNTSIFSNYGKAIKSLYDKKKTAAEVALKAYQTAKEYILPDAEVERLTTVMNEEEAKMKAAAETKKTLSLKISLAEKIADNSRRRDEAERKLTELKTEMALETFLKMKELCSDWDKTDNERKAMSDLLAYGKTLAEARKEEEAIGRTFAKLASCLAAESSKCETDAIALSDEATWLDSRNQRDSLYTDAKATIAAIEQYTKDCNAIESLRKETTEAENLIEPLSEKEQEANSEKEEAEKQAALMQAAIDELSKRRDALDSKQMDIQTHQLATLRMAYQKLKEDHNEWLENQKEFQKLNDSRAELQKKLTDSRTLRDTAETASKTAAREYEEAMKRWTAINASLDEKLDDLRKQIRDGKAEICPLCGQKIADTILTKEQFATLVSPYEAERERTKANAEKTQKELTAAIGSVSALEGELKTLDNQLQKLAQTIADTQKALAVRMEKADINPGSDIDAAIGQKLDIIANNEKELQQKRQQLAELQKAIDAKLQDKRPLDARLNKAIAQLAAAKEKCGQNRIRIENLKQKTEKAAIELKQAYETIDATLALWYPEWSDNTTQTASLLKTEAKEYTDRKRLHEQHKNALEKKQEQLKSIQLIKNQISENHPDWKATSEEQETTGEPLKEWNELSARCSANASTIASCRQILARCEETLQQWRQTSGKDDTYLAELTAKQDDVAAARRHIAEREGDLKTWTSIQANALTAIAEARKALNLGENDDAPDKNELERQYITQDSQEKESNAIFAEARAKLESNRAAMQKLESAQSGYEAVKSDYDHWFALNRRFGGDRFRNLVQTHILTPLLNNANIYLSRITERYTLTCNAENEQLSILVLDRFNRNEVRSAAVLSGGEKFMISLALSLALSSLNRPDMNVNILFIDEGFGTLDQECLNSVMSTLSRLGEMSGQNERRVGIISHREELLGCIPNKIKLKRIGEGRSKVEVVYEP